MHSLSSMFARLLLAALCLAPAAGCGIIEKAGNKADDLINEVLPVLDGAIESLNTASADWQVVLQNTVGQLTDEAQSTIRNEVNDLLVRGVASVGTEFRCNADFLRIRVRQGLIRIKTRLLGGSMPPLEPQLCEVVPLAVDMNLPPERRNKIEFYGYDFDSSNVQVFLVNGASEINVSQFLDRPTHYHLTLNLAGNGVALGPGSNRFILRWNGRNIQSVAILQPTVKICETSTVNPMPSPVSLTNLPRHTNGDREYNGNGPDVHATVTLVNQGDRVEARVYMRASETKSDWTRASETKTFTIYTAPSGKVIEKILSPAFAEFSYRDSNGNLDEFPGGGPVASWKFMGDGGGDDAGVHTRVEVTLSRLQLELKDNQDCVSSSTIRDLQTKGLLSPATFNIIKRGNPGVERMLRVQPDLQARPGSN
ncbi:MAG: hypothetical protein NW241_04435 [Bacteroidia bacterium]|nr:hypothetical protein [Bacteroidia bacterium]